MQYPKHIAITGASSGIGAALAERYAMPGIHLSLHGRDPIRLTKTATRAERQGAIVTTKCGEVTDTKTVASWIESCDAIEPLDLIIANAGISAGTGRGYESDDQSRAIFNTNVTGVLNTIQPAMPIMMRRRRGQIAIMSSLAGFRGIPGAPSYAASKAAVRIYGEALRNEMAHFDVEVNVICPGFIKTPMTEVNRFAMPFIMPAARAAQIIKEGLAKNKARIAFPFPMYALVRLMAALPLSWTDPLLRHMPKKS